MTREKLTINVPEPETRKIILEKETEKEIIRKTYKVSEVETITENPGKNVKITRTWKEKDNTTIYLNPEWEITGIVKDPENNIPRMDTKPKKDNQT